MAEGSGRFIEIGMPGSDCCVCELNVNTNNSQEHCMDGVGFGSCIFDVRNSDISGGYYICLLYTSPSPRDISGSRMPSSA